MCCFFCPISGSFQHALNPLVAYVDKQWFKSSPQRMGAYTTRKHIQWLWRLAQHTELEGPHCQSEHLGSRPAIERRSQHGSTAMSTVKGTQKSRNGSASRPQQPRASSGSCTRNGTSALTSSCWQLQLKLQMIPSPRQGCPPPPLPFPEPTGFRLRFSPPPPFPGPMGSWLRFPAPTPTPTDNWVICISRWSRTIFM